LPRPETGAFRANGTLAPALEALLESAKRLRSNGDLRALFHDLATRLHSVVEFDFLTLILTIP